MEIKLRLSGELVERAQRVGFAPDRLEGEIIAALEAEIRRREVAVSQDVAVSFNLEAKLTVRAAAELHRLVVYCQSQLPLAEFQLSEEYGYASLPLCIIDAIYSIGVKYESTQNVVKRFCAYTNIPPVKIDGLNSPSEFTILDLLALYQRFSDQEFADSIYQNRQRTSSRNGILKAEAVRRVSEVLRSFGVNILADVEKIAGQPDFEAAFKQIPGQGSGVSLRYFYMLTGSVEHIKPDRMIIRFIGDALGRPVKVGECQPLLVDVCRELTTEFPGLTPRSLDNLIWQYQRARSMPE